jgi:hypothetical protein
LQATQFSNVCYFFAINPLADLRTVAQVVNPTEITGKAIKDPSSHNSETLIKTSVPKQAFDNLTYFFLRLFLAFPS